MLKGILSEEIISIALVGSDNQIAVGVNSSLLAPHLSAIQDDTEVCHLDSQTSLQVSSGLYSGFKMVAMISDKAIMDRINAIAATTCLSATMESSMDFCMESRYFSILFDSVPLRCRRYAHSAFRYEENLSAAQQTHQENHKESCLQSKLPGAAGFGLFRCCVRVID